LDALTERDGAYDLIGEGMSNREIAQRLFLPRRRSRTT